MTQAQVRKEFWKMLKFTNIDLYKKSKPYKPSNIQPLAETKIEFNEFLNHLFNDGDITYQQKNNFIL